MKIRTFEQWHWCLRIITVCSAMSEPLRISATISLFSLSLTAIFFSSPCGSFCYYYISFLRQKQYLPKLLLTYVRNMVYYTYSWHMSERSRYHAETLQNPPHLCHARHGMLWPERRLQFICRNRNHTKPRTRRPRPRLRMQRRRLQSEIWLMCRRWPTTRCTPRTSWVI